jgi:stage V sporulation protein G
MNKVDKDSGEVTGVLNLEVRAFPIAEPRGSTKGYASVTVDGMFGAHGLSIIEGKNGLFVSMPQTKDGKGDYRDIFHPVTSEGRKALNDAVLAEYAVALDALAVKQESTLAKIQEAKRAASERPASDKAIEKAAAKTKNKSADER